MLDNAFLCGWWKKETLGGFYIEILKNRWAKIGTGDKICKGRRIYNSISARLLALYYCVCKIMTVIIIIWYAILYCLIITVALGI
jgi:hypothetical protein